MSSFHSVLDELHAFRAPPFTPGAAERVPEESLLEGLREIARARRELDVLQAAITTELARHRGRDTTAAVARTMNSSTREARNAASVGRVLDTVAGARDALLAGDVTPEHLRSLAPVCNDSDAATLLTLGAGRTPEEFAQDVTRHRINKDPLGWRERQHAARSVRFFDADDGCVGIRAILPTAPGIRIKNHLRNMVDAAWRRQHPERARVRGGREGEPEERRLADALVAAILDPQEIPHESTNGQGNATTGPNDNADANPSRNSLDFATTEHTQEHTENDNAGAQERATSSMGDVFDAIDRPDGTFDQANHVTRNNTHGVVRTSSTAKEPLSGKTARRRTGSRVDLVVTIDAATLDAQIVGHGPIPLADALDLVPQAELYALIHDTKWGNLKLGRNRRVASPLQRLAVMIRDKGKCRVEGCDLPADRCHVHHFDHYAKGGNTDVDRLGLLCTINHHPDEHEATRHIRTKKQKPTTQRNDTIKTKQKRATKRNPRAA